MRQAQFLTSVDLKSSILHLSKNVKTWWGSYPYCCEKKIQKWLHFWNMNYLPLQFRTLLCWEFKTACQQSGFFPKVLKTLSLFLLRSIDIVTTHLTWTPISVSEFPSNALGLSCLCSVVGFNGCLLLKVCYAYKLLRKIINNK